MLSPPNQKTIYRAISTTSKNELSYINTATRTETEYGRLASLLLDASQVPFIQLLDSRRANGKFSEHSVYKPDCRLVW